MTKAEAVEQLEARGMFVPSEWSAAKVKQVLADVESVEVAAPETPAAWEPGSPRG